MSKFKQYNRVKKAELRKVTDEDIDQFKKNDSISFSDPDFKNHEVRVSISAEDLYSGSPKKGDMIGRNPDNHKDQWLVNKTYFEKNFESINS